MAAKPRTRQKHARVVLSMPRPWIEMAHQLGMMTAQSQTGYMRDALIRQMMEDWQTTPGRGFTLRTGTTVFKISSGVFSPVASSLGGERVWPIENVGYLPASLGGGLAFRCDVVPVGTKTGLQAADVIIARDRFGSPVT